MSTKKVNQSTPTTSIRTRRAYRKNAARPVQLKRGRPQNSPVVTTSYMGFALPDDVKLEVSALAEKQGVSMSFVLRSAVRSFMHSKELDYSRTKKRTAELAELKELRSRVAELEQVVDDVMNTARVVQEAGRLLNQAIPGSGKTPEAQQIAAA